MVRFFASRRTFFEACGRWQSLQPSSITAWVTRPLNSGLAAWHFSQSALPEATRSFLFCEPWGLWQLVHLPSVTGGWTDAPRATLSWHSLQRAAPSLTSMSFSSSLWSRWQAVQSPDAAGSWVNLNAFIFFGKSSWHSKQGGSSARAGTTANADKPAISTAKPINQNRFRFIPVAPSRSCQIHTTVVG